MTASVWVQADEEDRDCLQRRNSVEEMAAEEEEEEFPQQLLLHSDHYLDLVDYKVSNDIDG